MIIEKPLPFVKEFVGKINEAIKEHDSEQKLTVTQTEWLSFCLMGIIVTNSVCWAKFERAGLKEYTAAALSWMFRKANIAWEILLRMSVSIILKKYGITEGSLVLDDSDRGRAKKTPRIFKSHKIKDKTSGGYINGQTIMMLMLVTPKITVPVGFSFYMPDPDLTAWEKADKRLAAKGIAKENRPAKPARNPEYPTKAEMAVTLLAQFQLNHPQIKVKVIDADALYGISQFMDSAAAIFGGVQVISQIRSNQIVRFRNKELSVEKYFDTHAGVEQKIIIRGGKEVKAIVSSARLYVKAHKKKRFVIALKYEGETAYRYLVATDLSWRTIDIIQAYTLRWLVEVFFEDWKMYEGWGQLTKQPDEEGSSRGLILSLLLDHCLLFHPEQLARLENKLPAATVGSLQQRVCWESLLAFIDSLFASDNPQARIELLSKTLKDVFRLNPSQKHMNGRDLGRLDPTPSLASRAWAA
jgi:hypothetical protein